MMLVVTIFLFVGRTRPARYYRHHYPQQQQQQQSSRYGVTRYGKAERKLKSLPVGLEADEKPA